MTADFRDYQRQIDSEHDDLHKELANLRRQLSEQVTEIERLNRHVKHYQLLSAHYRLCLNQRA